VGLGGGSTSIARQGRGPLPTHLAGCGPYLAPWTHLEAASYANLFRGLGSACRDSVLQAGNRSVEPRSWVWKPRPARRRCAGCHRRCWLEAGTSVLDVGGRSDGNLARNVPRAHGKPLCCIGRTRSAVAHSPTTPCPRRSSGVRPPW